MNQASKPRNIVWLDTECSPVILEGPLDVVKLDSISARAPSLPNIQPFPSDGTFKLDSAPLDFSAFSHANLGKSIFPHYWDAYQWPQLPVAPPEDERKILLHPDSPPPLRPDSPMMYPNSYKEGFNKAYWNDYFNPRPVDVVDRLALLTDPKHIATREKERERLREAARRIERTLIAGWISFSPLEEPYLEPKRRRSRASLLHTHILSGPSTTDTSIAHEPTRVASARATRLRPPRRLRPERRGRYGRVAG
jgi:hypothetical protein